MAKSLDSRSTIRIKHNTYSVPSRLISEMVRVRVYEDRLEVHFGNVLQLTVERLIGKGGHRIDYRHVINSLVAKPGAFPRFRYRVLFTPAYRLIQQLLVAKRDLLLEQELRRLGRFDAVIVDSC